MSSKTLALLLAVLAWIAPVTLAAQASHTAQLSQPAHASKPAQEAPPFRRRARIPVTVALVETLPTPGEPFVVRRVAGTVPGHVILLPRVATAGDLSDALHAVGTLHAADSAAVPAVGTFRVRPRGAERRPARRFPWAARVLADLRGARAAPVDGVGTVPHVRVWLPIRSAGRSPRAAQPSAG
jgi:hypothetical protein